MSVFQEQRQGPAVGVAAVVLEATGALSTGAAMGATAAGGAAHEIEARANDEDAPAIID